MTDSVLDIAVTCALTYLAIGAVFWMLLVTSGRVGRTYEKWAARGEAPSAVVTVLAIVLVVLAWPVPFYHFVCGLAAGARSQYRGEQ